MHTTALKIELYGRRVTAFFGVVIAVSALLYGVFLLLAVEHTASRAKMESAVRALSSELGTLQSQYLAATRELTRERAQELGFVVPNAAATVYASAPSRVLSLNNGGH